jgi:DNA-binding transcriptional LysR family regulator
MQIPSLSCSQFDETGLEARFDWYFSFPAVLLAIGGQFSVSVISIHRCAMDRFSEFEIYVEVVERGDYSSAARSLNLTPSAVSKAVKRLEDKLGARLLERTSRSMRVTTEGETFYAAVKRALDAAMEAEASVSGSLGTPAGDLRVQLPVTFAIYQVARVMPEFQQRYPAIRVAFILRNEPLDMAEHRIDVAVTIGRPRDSDLLVRKIATTKWVICASPLYLARRGRPETRKDLTKHACLGYALDAPRNNLFRSEEPEASDVMSIESRIAANNGSMLQAMARVGCGIVRLAEYHVAADLATGRLVQLFFDEPDEREDVFALYPRKSRNSARVRAFTDFLQEKFSSASWGVSAA